MRAAGTEAGDVDRMQAWAGQSAGLAKAAPAAEVLASVWDSARTLLGDDLAELERRYARSVGRDRLAAVLRGLAAFVEGAEQD